MITTLDLPGERSRCAAAAVPAIGAVYLHFVGARVPALEAVGELVHGWLFRILGEVDPVLFASLHAPRTSRQPFTIAPVRAGPSVLWVRLSWISERTGLGLTRALEFTLGSVLRLGSREMRFDGHEPCPAWGGSVEQWLAGACALPSRRASQNLTMRFASPTMFRHQAHNLMFPTPEHVFGSLIRTWNANCVPAIPEAAARDVLDRAVVRGYRLSTKRTGNGRYPEYGFTGTCTYGLVPWDSTPWGLASALAAFGEFAGVGYKASMGMGRVEVVTDRRPRRPTGA